MNSTPALETALPRKVLLEQLSRILPADDSLPEQVGVKKLAVEQFERKVERWDLNTWVTMWPAAAQAC